jgi:hypothetical protein
MKSFIILTIVLATVLIAVSLLLDNLMGIFLVCTVVCLLLDAKEKERHNNRPDR